LLITPQFLTVLADSLTGPARIRNLALALAMEQAARFRTSRAPSDMAASDCAAVRPFLLTALGKIHDWPEDRQTSLVVLRSYGPHTRHGDRRAAPSMRPRNDCGASNVLHAADVPALFITLTVELNEMQKVLEKKTLALAMVLVGACLAIGATVSNAANKSDVSSNPFDPCGLVTVADLRAALGVTFTNAHGSENVDIRDCEYDNDKLLVRLYTSHQELSEFQADNKEGIKKNATWGKSVRINSVTAPAYPVVGEGRLVVWKNKITVTVGILDGPSAGFA
jgi:hypothetical protein